MEAKDTMWNMKATPGFIKRLNKTAEVLDRPASQIVREAVAEKIEELAKSNPALKAALKQLAA